MELQQNKWKHVHEKQKGEKQPWYAMNRDTITIQDLELFEKPKEEQPFSEGISSAFKEFASTLHQFYKISCAVDSDSYVLKNIKKKDIMELDQQSSDSEAENEDDDESNAKFHKKLSEEKRQHKQYLRKIGAPLPESVTSTKKKKSAEEDDSEDDDEEEEEEHDEEDEEDMSDDEPSNSKNQNNNSEEEDFAFSKLSKDQKLKVGKQPKVSKKKLLAQLEKEKQELENLPMDQKASKVSDKKLQSSLLKLEGKREVNEKTLKHKLKIQKQKKNKSKKEWTSKIEKESEDIKHRKEKRDENRKNKKNRGKKEFLQQQKKEKSGGIKKQKKMRPGFEGKKDKTLN